MQALVIVCQRREIEHLLDALEDGNIVLYGSTPKAQDGFIVMHWTQPIPKVFEQKQLKADPGIIDYLVYDLPPVLNTDAM